jgi:recombination protein RecA
VLNDNLAEAGFNQLRQKIGVVYGNPETTTGGNALKFYASVRLDIRKIGVVKNGDQVVGNHARVKVVKNKVAPPFREAEFDILYGVGVNAPGEVVDLPSAAGLFEKAGAFYSFRSERIGQGRDRPAPTSPSTRRSPRRSGGSCWRRARRRTPPSVRR